MAFIKKVAIEKQRELNSTRNKPPHAERAFQLFHYIVAKLEQFSASLE